VGRFLNTCMRYKAKSHPQATSGNAWPSASWETCQSCSLLGKGFRAEGQTFDEDRLTSQPESFSFSNLCPVGTACTKYPSNTDRLTHFVSSNRICYRHTTKTRFASTTFALNCQEFYSFLAFQPRFYSCLRHLLNFLHLDFSLMPLFKTTAPDSPY
jgi:hypothetical protein